MLFPRIRTRLQKGLTLIELMLVLSVACAIIVSAARFAMPVNAAAKVTRAVDMGRTVLEAANTWAQSQTDTSGLNVKLLIANGLLPSTFENASANPWGGIIQINGDFQLTFSKAPVDDCTILKNLLKPYIITCPAT